MQLRTADARQLITMLGMVILRVRQAQHCDRDELARMRVLLWPDGSFEEHLSELDAALSNRVSGTLPVTILVSQNENGALLGFVEVGLRSHADGCDPARPVGFVEGWFVHEAFRNHGVGGELMRAAEEWARAQGCLEMASDALIENEQSQRAHEALGFEVVDRCVHFRKKL
jgi:aminoglycoside 6'-N-acetyltransferase I